MARVAKTPDRWQVIEAIGSGVSPASLASVAPDGWYKIIRPPAGVEPSRTVAFARHQVGDEYGYLTVLGCALDILPPRWLKWPLRFRTRRTWICSALGAESLRFGGWYAPWGTIYSVTPAQVMRALLESGGTEVPLATARPGDVGLSHSTGLIAWAIRLAQRIAGEPTWEVNHCFVLERLLRSAPKS